MKTQAKASRVVGGDASVIQDDEDFSDDDDAMTAANVTKGDVAPAADAAPADNAPQ